MADSTREVGDKGDEEAQANDAPSAAPAGRAAENGDGAPEESPTLSASWQLRAAAIVAAIGSLMGFIVAPGMRGNATDRVVVVTDTIASGFAYLMAALLLSLVVRGMLETLKAKKVSVVARVALAFAALPVVAMTSVAIFLRLRPWATVPLALGAAVASLSAGISGLRAPHTRAVAFVVTTFGIAALVRLLAWEIASHAGEQASTQLYGVSRGLATVAVLLESFAQLAAAVWIGTRGKLVGQITSFVALVVALVMTFGVAQGVHGHASFWQSVMHTALADAPGSPPPYGLGAVATFLISASILLAAVAAAQPGQVAGVVSALALALVARGAFDVPLRALAAVAAAQWIAVAMSDDRAMWRALIDQRKREGAQSGTVP